MSKSKTKKPIVGDVDKKVTSSSVIAALAIKTVVESFLGKIDKADQIIPRIILDPPKEKSAAKLHY